MSVSSINPNTPAVTPTLPAVTPPVPQVRDSDGDGDGDVAGSVRASTPPGVGGLVDKDV